MMIVYHMVNCCDFAILNLLNTQNFKLFLFDFHPFGHLIEQLALVWYWQAKMSYPNVTLQGDPWELT